MTGNETLFASTILFASGTKYVRPFDLEKLKTYVWKQRSKNNEYVNASAPCFTGTSVEELFYCEDHFRDAMEKLEKTAEEWWFVQLKNLLHGLAKDIWLEVLDDGDLEHDGQPFDQEDADGFIKAMDQYGLQFCPQRNAKTSQLRAMCNFVSNSSEEPKYQHTSADSSDRSSSIPNTCPEWTRCRCSIAR